MASLNAKVGNVGGKTAFDLSGKDTVKKITLSFGLDASDQDLSKIPPPSGDGTENIVEWMFSVFAKYGIVASNI